MQPSNFRFVNIGSWGLCTLAIWYLTGPNYGFGSLSRLLPNWLLKVLSRTRATALPSNPEAADTRILAVLDELCMEFHSIFMELAQISASVRRTIKLRDAQSSVGDEPIESMLMEQGYSARLAAAEAKVLKSFGISKKELKSLADRSTSPQVKLRVQGLKSMFADALKGSLPLRPGVTLPRALQDQVTVLDIVTQIHKKKISLFEKIFESSSPRDLEPLQSEGGSLLPSAALSKKLAEATETAESEVLKANAELTGQDERLYRHALAVHSRNPDFVRQKAIADDLHSSRIVETMKKAFSRGPGKLSTTGSTSPLSSPKATPEPAPLSSAVGQGSSSTPGGSPAAVVLSVSDSTSSAAAAGPTIVALDDAASSAQ